MMQAQQKYQCLEKEQKMSKRKETRSVVSFAIRHKAEGTRTEYKLLEFDGEADDLALIHQHDDVDTLTESQCLQIIKDAGFLCDAVKIEVVSEKSAEKDK